MSHIPIIGELVVVALKAENLQHQALNKQDPFCVFRVGDIIKRTKADPGGGLNPIWDDQVNIPILQGQRQLMMQIFNRDNNLQNLMAEGHLDLSTVFRDREFDGYFPLTYRGHPGFGEILLELTFYPAQNANSLPLPQQAIRNNYRPNDPNVYRPPRPQYTPVQPYRPPMPASPSMMSQLPFPPPHQRPPMAFPRPSASMGTNQYAPIQPLLSSPFNPVLAPTRPMNNNMNNMNGRYPNDGYPPSTNYPPANYPVASYSTPHYPTQPTYPSYPAGTRPPPPTHFNRPPTHYPPY